MTQRRNERTSASPNDRAKRKQVVDIKGTKEDTTSVRARYWLTNDILAFVLILSFVGLMGVAGRGIIDLSTIPVEIRVVYVSLVGASGVWAFGETAFERWRNTQEKNSK